MRNLLAYKSRIEALTEKLAHELDGEENIVVLFSLLSLVASGAQNQGDEDMTLEARAQIYDIAIDFLMQSRARFLKEATNSDELPVH